MKIFAAKPTKLNNDLYRFPGSSSSKKMAPEELNDILLHAVPNAWAKQAYLQGRYFEGRIYNGICEIFEHMEIIEQFYEGGNTYKNINRAEAEYCSHDRKSKGGETTYPINPKKGHDGKHKTNYSGHPSNRPVGANRWLVHGTGKSTEELKLLKEYSKQ